MNLEMPLVSFLMPVYNGEKTVARAIESMLNQTYERIEIVILDDGSLDNSHLICCGYAEKDSRIRVYRNSENLGVAKTLNKGLALCEGEYITRMDADDKAMSGMIEKQVKYMQAHRNVGVLASNYITISEATGSITKVALKRGNMKLKCCTLFSTPFANCGTMLRADMLSRNKAEYPIHPAEDYAFWAKLMNLTDFEVLPEILFEIYTSDDNITSSNHAAIRSDSAEISKSTIHSQLGIDVSEYPDIHFGWRGNDAVPYDLCGFLEQSSQLLCKLRDANNKIGKFNEEVMDEILTLQWRTSIFTASMSLLCDDYAAFSKADYEKAIESYLSMENSRVVIYSTGNYVSEILNSLQDCFPFEIVGFIDSDVQKHETEFYGKDISPPEKLSEMSYDYVLIGSTIYFDEIKSFLINDLKIEEEKLLNIRVANDIVLRKRRDRYIDRLMLAQSSNKPIAYMFIAPDYGNMGDHAIAEGAHRFFKDIGYELIEVPLRAQNEFSEVVKHHIRINDLVLIAGGGFFGSLWLGGERPARNVIAEYPDNRIIVLPQTVYWEDNLITKRELGLTQDIYAGHKDLTLFARDRTTFESTQKLYPKTKIMLAPDMALYGNFGRYYSDDNVRKGALLCLKFDKESVLSEEQKQDLLDIARKISLEARNRSTDSYKLIWIEDRTSLLEDLLQDFASAELVITDRLHGCIFAAVTGTPCVVLGAYSHKNKATFEWVKHLPYMRFSENIDSVEALARVVLDEGPGKFDNTPMKVYFDELRNSVNK